MSNYVQSTPFSDEFDGDKVTAELAPLSIVDLVRIQSAIGASEEELMRIHAEVLPRYVKNFSGLTAKDGTPVAIEEVSTVAYFFNLATKIGTKIAEAASPPSKPSETSVS